MSDLQSKTDEELNEQLAKLVGWKCRCESWPSKPYQRIAWNPPSSNDHVWLASCPRFSASLDEVARVEAGLTDEQRRKYFERLIWEPCDEAVHKIGWNWADMDDDDYITALFANPRQRTIALIQTLIFNSRSYGHAKPSPPIPPSPSNPPNHQNEQ